jgi:hypothetical protein
MNNVEIFFYRDVRLPLDMLNAKKVFRHDSATRKLISADAVQLKGDYSAICFIAKIY